MAQLKDTIVDGTLFVRENITIGEETIKDYIVETGASGVWYYEKWNSGKLHYWGVVSFVSTGTSNTFTVTLPFDFIDTAFCVQATPSRNGTLVTSYAECNSTANVERTVNSFMFSYYMTSAYGVNFNFDIIGRWK